MHEPLADESQPVSYESPEHFLGSTSLLDLQDSRLRLRARSLTQLCKSDREKAMVVHDYVKRLPFDPMVVQTLGVYHDPLHFVRSDLFRSKYRPLARLLHLNMLALGMRRVVRKLREEGSAKAVPGRVR